MYQAALKKCIHACLLALVVAVAVGAKKLPHPKGNCQVFSGRITKLLREVGALEVTRAGEPPISMEFTTTLSTRIIRRGKPILLTDLQEQEEVRVRYYDNAAVERIDVIPPKPPPQKPQTR